MSCVTREIVLPVPRERAWELVTEEDELREWLADEVEFEAEEGAPLRFDDREGVVERVEPGELIEFSWEGSRVLWELEDHDQGTRFVVTIPSAGPPDSPPDAPPVEATPPSA